MKHPGRSATRAEYAAWREESARVERERNVRIACVRIAARTAFHMPPVTAMLGFIQQNEADYEIRLQCLEIAAEIPGSDAAELIKRAEKMLGIVCAADNA